jgi:F0F1-type ATP synthase membrane subunit b/b'
MLQVFLYLNIFLIGVLVVLAVQHAYAHFKPHEHDAEHHRQQPEGGHLPPAVRQQLLEDAQKDFERVLRRSAAELQQDLENSSESIKKQLDKFSKGTVAGELEQYRAKIAELEKQTESVIGGMHQEITSHQDDLKAKIIEEVEAEKQRMLQQIDTKLADAVASFLSETLQHNVDLGAQSAYLMSVLEEHKSELAKEVGGEA